MTSAPERKSLSREAWLCKVSREAWLRSRRRQSAHGRAALPLVAELVASIVPQGAVVADVGGGDGQLSLHLQDLGLKPLLIEPRFGDGDMDAGALRNVRILPRPLRPADVNGVDLVVGYHPCGATPMLTRIRQRPVVIIPCCNWYWWIRGRWGHREVAHLCLTRAGRIRADVLITQP